MADVRSCIKGKFGPWEYYQITMKAADVASKLTLPKDIPGWSSLSLEEKYQRKLNKNRAAGAMAEYLSKNEWRFYGSILVTVLNGNDMTFTPVKEFVKDELGPIYKKNSDNIGFLHFSGKEIFVPLDGQHRFASLKCAISGKTVDDREIKNYLINPDVSLDDVSLILINHKPQSRHIFNKVNRYAKATSKGDNIITSDDDVIAIISREMCDYNELGLLEGRMVTIEGTTLSDNTHEFTTLSTLYDNNLDIAHSNGHDISEHTLPDISEINIIKSEILSVWKILLKEIKLWNEALKDQSESGDQVRSDLRKEYSIMKPFGQRALVKAYLLMLNNYKCKNSGKFLTGHQICERLNGIDWKLNNETWSGTMTKAGGKIESGKDNLLLAAKLISHLCGTDVDDKSFRDKLKNKTGKGLPKTEF